MPNFGKLSCRQKDLVVHNPDRPSTGALHLLIDGTGVKAEGDSDRFADKHGPSKLREWRKVPLAIDADTLEIRTFAGGLSRQTTQTGCPDPVFLMSGGPNPWIASLNASTQKSASRVFEMRHDKATGFASPCLTALEGNRLSADGSPPDTETRAASIARQAICKAKLPRGGR